MVEIFDPLGMRRRFDDEATGGDDASFFTQMPLGAAVSRIPPLSAFQGQPAFPQGVREIPPGPPARSVPRDIIQLLRPGESAIDNPDLIELMPFIPGERQPRMVPFGNRGTRDINPGIVRPVPSQLDDPGLIRQPGADFIDPTFARRLSQSGDENRFRLPVGADGRIDERQLVPGRKFVSDTDGTEWRYNGDKFVKQSSPKRRLTPRQMQKRVTGQGPTAVRVTPEEMQNQIDLADATQRADLQKGVEFGGSQAEASGSVPSETPIFSFDENDPKFMSQFPLVVDPRAEAQKIADALKEKDNNAQSISSKLEQKRGRNNYGRGSSTATPVQRY